MKKTETQPKKAYRDPTFMDSRDARPVRILAEYLGPESRFEHFDIVDTIVFFGSARTLDRQEAKRRLAKAEAEGGDIKAARKTLELADYYEATRELAHRLTEWSKGLKDSARRFVICNGGGPGIMEAASRGASEAKGLNIGLTISLSGAEPINPYVSRELAMEFHYFFMRKYWMTYLAKAMVVMPGGFGTLDELFEILTLIQTAKIKKRLPIVLFGNDYWSRIINFDVLAEYGTIDPADLDLFYRTDSVDDAFTYITRDLTEHALNQRYSTL